jgi:hypothetical protein
VRHEIPQPGAPLSPDSEPGAEYSGKTFTTDLIGAGIVAVILIAQSLASRFSEESE